MEILDVILARLSATDDADFWVLAVPLLLREAAWDLEQAAPRRPVYARVGACSHWLRPHQMRWTAAGGFAWPVGYGDAQYTYRGAPEFDWSVLARWDHEAREWREVAKVTAKRPMLLRAALPTRTIRHAQAAVHTIWLPTNPARARPKSILLHGFRKIDGVWQHVTGADSLR